jgi:tRNA G18 (ribose-2'-O)-methylase SpoU
LSGEREAIVACPPLRSNVNLSRIVRTASCCGFRRMIVCGSAKVDPKIARDGSEQVRLDVRRSLPPVLKKLRGEGYRLVGVEQTSDSQSIYEYAFQPRSVIVLGHERNGLQPDVLELLDDVVEIPVYGLPHSYNVASAAAMVLYEYCKQMS